MVASYLLAAGPFVYIAPTLPEPIEKAYYFCYAPIDVMLRSKTIWESPVGQAYYDYISWWADLREFQLHPPADPN